MYSTTLRLPEITVRYFSSIFVFAYIFPIFFSSAKIITLQLQCSIKLLTKPKNSLIGIVHLSKSSKHITISLTSILPSIFSNTLDKSVDIGPIENENALLATPIIPASGFNPFFTNLFPFPLTYIK